MCECVSVRVRQGETDDVVCVLYLFVVPALQSSVLGLVRIIGIASQPPGACEQAGLTGCIQGAVN